MHLCSTFHIMTRNIFIVLLCFKNIITHVISLEPFQVQECSNTTLVLEIRKLRQAPDHFFPAFPLFLISFVPYIPVRLTGQFYLKSKRRHGSELRTSILMKWMLKSWDKEAYLDIYMLHACFFERDSYILTCDDVFPKGYTQIKIL